MTASPLFIISAPRLVIEQFEKDMVLRVKYKTPVINASLDVRVEIKKIAHNKFGVVMHDTINNK